MKKYIWKSLPWIITAVMLHFAFKGIDFNSMLKNFASGNLFYLSLAFLATLLSYLLRAIRWRYFFTESSISLKNSYPVLIMGFFMNNVLPARAGEFIRAHLGAKFTKTKRTLVLATIANERLTDGLCLSGFLLLMILLSNQSEIDGLSLVALGFFLAAIFLFFLLLFRRKLFILTDKISKKFDIKALHYLNTRIQIFINGLMPIFNLRVAPLIAIQSLIIWSVELLVFFLVSLAFNSEPTLLSSILFMVAVNFSSLIPSAPAGIGVIEAVATQFLVTYGLNRELALSMVISQHLIQFIAIAIPGTYFALRYKKYLSQISEEENTEKEKEKSIHSSPAARA